MHCRLRYDALQFFATAVMNIPQLLHDQYPLWGWPCKNKSIRKSNETMEARSRSWWSEVCISLLLYCLLRILRSTVGSLDRFQSRTRDIFDLVSEQASHLRPFDIFHLQHSSFFRARSHTVGPWCDYMMSSFYLLLYLLAGYSTWLLSSYESTVLPIPLLPLKLRKRGQPK